MANTKSAEKRARQADTRRQRNRSVKSAMRSQIKEFRTVIEEGDEKKTREALAKTYSVIDRAAKRNVIHDNTADRYKARLAAAAKRAHTA